MRAFHPFFTLVHLGGEKLSKKQPIFSPFHPRRVKNWGIGKKAVLLAFSIYKYIYSPIHPHMHPHTHIRAREALFACEGGGWVNWGIKP